MKLTWAIEDHDVEKVRAFYAKWSQDPLVRSRQKRNIEYPRPAISKETMWMALVGCLLTTQQRSGPGSAVKRFLDTAPFPLAYAECIRSSDAEELVLEKLRASGGIRRSPTIARQLSANLKILKNNLWQLLLGQAQELNLSDDPVRERDLAHLLAEHLEGIGPKQSCNLLQWLGVSKYEIPIDSRITKWLNRTLLNYHLSANLLSDMTYYDMVSDGIQALCKEASLYPCLLDAAVFTSFDGGWTESDVGVAESLATA